MLSGVLCDEGTQRLIMFLSKKDLVEFTGYQVVHYQIKALTAFGVPFKIGTHGRPIILKSTVENFLDKSSSTRIIEECEPNWNTLGA